MATDYAEKERAFIAALAEDTGRDLDGWMTAITATGVTGRNEIIDWLRHQGFAFARASWMERIHHNGGRLIYAELESALGEDGFEVRPAAEVEMQPPAAEVQVQRPAAAPRLVFTAADPPLPRGYGGDVAGLLNAAKGLRPLAVMVLNEIQSAVSTARFEARDPLILALAPQPILALWTAPKKLRLYGSFGHANGGLARTAEPVLKAAPPFPHMIVLDDARRIDEAFRALVRSAADLRNG